MPLVDSTFRPPPMIRTPWLQTIAPALFRKSARVSGKNYVLELSDGDFLELEWHTPQRPKGSDATVILTHGLEGSTKSTYLVGLIAALIEQGYHVLAWNMRGCGSRRNRLITWYHSGQTSDLGVVTEHALDQYPTHSIHLVGISIGGNIVVKFLGELGSATPKPIKGAIAISPPLDLRGSALTLAKPSRALYMQYLLKPLRARLAEKALRFPGKIDLSTLSQIRSFYQFDERFTAPLHNFSSVDHYWDSCSGIHFLASITVPTHILSALDDPFLCDSCFPIATARSSPLLSLETPKYGGHVGFIDSLNMKTTWLEQRVVQILSESELPPQQQVHT